MVVFKVAHAAGLRDGVTVDSVSRDYFPQASGVRYRTQASGVRYRTQASGVRYASRVRVDQSLWLRLTTQLARAGLSRARSSTDQSWRDRR
jgi:hypothetical protein